MSEQGFGDTLQFSRYALWLQQKGFEVTLLSQLSRSTTTGSRWTRQRSGQTRHSGLANSLSGMDATSDVLPNLQAKALDALRVTSRSQPIVSTLGNKSRNERQEKLVALHWQGNQSMKILFIHEDDPSHLKDC